jgi:anti-anti-sigma factor
MEHAQHLYTPTGRIDASNAAVAEKDMLARLEAAQYRLVIDLSGIEYLSSAGLRALLVAAKTAKSHGGMTVLAAPRPTVAEVFKMSGFEKIIKITPTATEALAYLQPT